MEVANKKGRKQMAFLLTVLEHIHLILQAIPGFYIVSQDEGDPGGKRWTVTLGSEKLRWKQKRIRLTK